MSEVWEKHDRPCPPCPYCGAELYEKFWGGGGWVPSDKESGHAHGNCIKVVADKLAAVTRERDEARTRVADLAELADDAIGWINHTPPAFDSEVHELWRRFRELGGATP